MTGADAEGGGFGLFLDEVGDVAPACGVADFGEGEGGELHDFAHLELCLLLFTVYYNIIDGSARVRMVTDVYTYLLDFLQDCAKAGGEGISLCG